MIQGENEAMVRGDTKNFEDRSQLVRLRDTDTVQTAHCALHLKSGLASQCLIFCPSPTWKVDFRWVVQCPLVTGAPFTVLGVLKHISD